MTLVLLMVVAGAGPPAATAGPAVAPAPAVAGSVTHDSLMRNTTAGIGAYNRAMAAYKTKDYEGYLAGLRESARRLGPHPALIRRLAGACALTGRRDEALAFLARYVDLQVAQDLAADPDLATLRDLEAFKGLVARQERLKIPVTHGAVAYRLPEKDLLTEGIAFDPGTGSFFVSSVHRRKVVRISRDGVVSDFVAGDRGRLWGPLGLRADPARRSLWVVSAAGPAMSGYREADKGQTALHRFDLDTGDATGFWTPPDTVAGHGFNDLTTDAAGRVYLSDPGVGALYTLPPDGKRIEVLLGPKGLPAPQGLALSRDEKTLYVADYQLGLFAMELASRRLAPVAAPDSVTLVGIDGLIAFGGDLIAIQNGIRPHRVVRLRLNAAGNAVEGTTLLDRDHPLFDEPTLGVIAGDDLDYIANSQWGSFGPDAPAGAADRRQEPVILRVRLR